VSACGERMLLGLGLGRVVLASFAAALAACIVMLSGSENDIDPEVFVGLLSITFLVALPHALLLGLPYACWLHRLRRESLLTMAAGGFVIGALPMCVLAGAEAIVAICGASGAAGAGVLHLANRMREGRSTPA